MLETQREKIDTIDAQLMSLLTQRLAVSREIATEKARTHTPLTNKEREQAIYEQVKAAANPEVQGYLKTLFEDIILVSKQYQAHVIQEITDSEK
ncbi:chorismate mutase [Lapidilactobacillus bayanensis]|uniref:chorismate mutase n=1 Tax=Lapidilactobacillus bayanensis TaxID=2485998 RepID=UPI000F7ACBF4|nr:chorismate mutase [Lapidilactobacillus bayanensis]